MRRQRSGAIREPNFGIGSVMLAVLGAIALGIYIAKAALPFSVVTLDRPMLAFAGVTGQTWPGVLQYILTLGLPVLLYGAGFLVLWRSCEQFAAARDRALTIRFSAPASHGVGARAPTASLTDTHGRPQCEQQSGATAVPNISR